MVKEAEIARHLGHLNDASVGRLIRCLQAYELPTSIDDILIKRFTLKKCAVNQLMDIMKIDKKTIGNQKKIVLLSKIGNTWEEKASSVADDIIQFVLSPSVCLSSNDGNQNVDSVELCVPGSKSISNRALLLASLGSGVCRIRGLLHSDDVKVLFI